MTSHPALGALPLARADVDRRCDRRTEEGWLDGLRANAATRHLVMIGGRARVLDGELALLDLEQVPEGGTELYLGFDGSAEIVLHSFRDAPESADGPAGTHATHPGEWLGLRDVAAGLGARDAGLFVEAVAIANWNHSMNFCPSCGGKLDLRDSGWVKHCAAEDIEHFPRTDPAIIVAITDAARPAAAGRQQAMGRTPLLHPGRVRGARRIPGVRGDPRGRRGIRGHGAQPAVHGLPALAVPVLADARVHAPRHRAPS